MNRAVSRLSVNGYACATVLATCLAGSAAKVAAQSTVLTVIVSRADSHLAIPNANVRVPSLGLSASTDSLGRVVFKDLHPGVVKVTARYPGLVQATTSVLLGLSDSTDLFLTLETAGFGLDTVRVHGRLEAPYLTDFYTRKRMGLGHFLTPEQLDSAGGEPVADFMATHFLGVRPSWSPDRMGVRIRSLRGYYSLRGVGECYVQVYVDGMLASGEELASLRSAGVAGAEFYSNAPPVQYSRAGAICGVILLWRRQ